MQLIDISRLRLSNQQIDKTVFKHPGEIVNWMVAMQAQEFAFAKWAIGLRLPASNDEMVTDAFNKGQILRTHLMRPTWHFVTPADIRWLLQLTAPHVHKLNAFMYRQLELDATIFKKTDSILVKALAGDKYLMRKELQSILEQKKIFAEGLRLIYIMMHAELEGLICSGPRKGKQFTYALLDERVPATKSINRDEALAAFAHRYFTSRGPATIKDFAYWSGLSVKDAKSGASSLDHTFLRETVDGEEYIFTNPKHTLKNSGITFLMPIYDEYGMSYKNRSALNQYQIPAGTSKTFNNFIVTNGSVSGGWKPVIKGKALSVEASTFISMNQTQESGLQKAIKKYQAFMGDKRDI